MLYRVSLISILIGLPMQAGSQASEALDLNQRGMDAAARRDFAAAERDYQQAIAIYRSMGAPFEAHLSVALFNFAETLCGEGEWAKSHAIFEESLALSRRALGTRDLHALTALNALGHVETVLGQFDAAESRFREAEAEGRESHPRDIQLAFALAGLATLRLREGAPDAALPYADEALRISVAAQPRETVDTALMYLNAGQIHRAAGRSARALPLLRKARAIFEREDAGAEADPRYALLLSTEGLAMMDDGKLVAANTEMLRAIELLDPCEGCGFELAIARNNLGLLRLRQKKYAEADNLLQTALLGEERYSPPGGAEIAATRKALDQARALAR